MNPVKKEYEIGVIIGRFQVHELHGAHLKLIGKVVKNHKRVVLFLGVAPTLATRNNPLDFETRARMIREQFPEISIMPMKDRNNDKEWSNEIDRRIKEVFPMGTVVLYGSRDSFIPHYKGKFDTLELEQEIFVSGTEVRKSVSEEIKSDSNFRAGVIYATHNQYPKVFPTVDVVVVKGNKFVLGKKPGESKYRFVGGFVDPSDESLEMAASREAKEELGMIEIADFEYISSRRIDDWRYRKEVDSITTTFFACKYLYGAIKPADDISEARWFEFEGFLENPKEDKFRHMKLSSPIMNKLIMPEHHQLFMDFFEYLKERIETNKIIEITKNVTITE